MVPDLLKLFSKYRSVVLYIVRLRTTLMVAGWSSRQISLSILLLGRRKATWTAFSCELLLCYRLGLNDSSLETGRRVVFAVSGRDVEVQATPGSASRETSSG